MSQNTKRKISPAVQDRTQAGKVALGEPAVGRQHAEIQRGQREHGEQDLNVVSEKDRGKRDAVEHRVGEEQAAGRADAQLMPDGRKAPSPRRSRQWQARIPPGMPIVSR